MVCYWDGQIFRKSTESNKSWFDFLPESDLFGAQRHLIELRLAVIPFVRWTIHWILFRIISFRTRQLDEILINSL